jgi:hypothetical protein
MSYLLLICSIRLCQFRNLRFESKASFFVRPKGCFVSPVLATQDIYLLAQSKTVVSQTSLTFDARSCLLDQLLFEIADAIETLSI